MAKCNTVHPSYETMTYVRTNWKKNKKTKHKYTAHRMVRDKE
jgi:hypothetical protein